MQRLGQESLPHASRVVLGSVQDEPQNLSHDLFSARVLMVSTSRAHALSLSTAAEKIIEFPPVRPQISQRVGTVLDTFNWQNSRLELKNTKTNLGENDWPGCLLCEGNVGPPELSQTDAKRNTAESKNRSA
jgi:hypothetical protein